MAAGCVGAFAQTAAVVPLPLDPLSDEERARALDIALSHDDVRRELDGERHRVIGTSLRVDKERTFEGARLVDVKIYRYGSDDVVWPVVDLSRSALDSLSVQRFQPILVLDELAEAEAALAAHPDVRALVGSTADLNIRAIAVGGEEGPCATHRCIQAELLRGVASLGVFAVYDLSAQAVVRVWDGSASEEADA